MAEKTHAHGCSAGCRCEKCAGDAARLAGFLRRGSGGDAIGPARLHTGQESADLLRGFGAAGLSVGRHVLLDPALDAGRSAGVLRHELAHVHQARGREPDWQRPLALSDRSDSHEREASAIAAGRPTRPSVRIHPNVISRDDGAPSGSGSAKTCPSCHPAQYPSHQLPKYTPDDLSQYDVKTRGALQCAAHSCHIDYTHAKWDILQREDADKALAAQKGSDLKSDIQATETALISQRLAMINEAADQTGTRIKIPADLAPRWAQARAAVEIVSDSISETQDVPLEVSEPSRTAFRAFYWALLQVAEAKEQLDDETEAFFNVGPAPKASQQMQCPGGCHAPAAKSSPFDFPTFKAPPKVSPGIQKSLDAAEGAKSVKEWQQAVVNFNNATATMDSLVVARLPSTSKALQGFQYAQQLSERQTKLLAERPNAIKIPAVFFPLDEFEEIKDKEGNVLGHPLKQLPWQLYLYHTGPQEPGQPLPSDAQWVLEDLTSPRNFKARTTGISSADAERLQKGDKNVDPPHSLFEQLNNKLRFPKGRLHWAMPSGAPDSAEMTQPITWSEFLSYVGLALTAVALIVASAGLATPAAILLVAAAGASIASTLLNLKEKEEYGQLTQHDINRAVLTIALDIASALTVGLGRIAAAAAETAKIAGTVSRVGVLAGRLWLPARVATTALEGVNIIVTTDEVVGQIRAVWNHPTMSKEAKEAALAKLVGLGLLMGGVQLFAFRSGIKELKTGSPLRVEYDAQGKPRLVQDGPAGRIEADVEAGTPKIKKDQEPFGPPRRPGDPSVGEDSTLQKGQVFIDATYGPDGRLASTTIRHAPGVPQHDIDIHVTACDLLSKASGAEGRLQQFVAKARLAWRSGRGAPLNLQVEIWKHEQMLAARKAMLVDPKVTDAQLKSINSEITGLEKRLGAYEAALKDATLQAPLEKTLIATKGTAPPGYPNPPGPMRYELVGKRWTLVPEEGYTGPRLAVEYDAAGNPTGRITNTADLVESGVIGEELNKTNIRRLRELGYIVKEDGTIARPTGGYTEKTATKYMEPLTVGPDGKIRVSERQTLADVQEQIKSQLSIPQKKALASLEKGAAKGETVLVVEGMYDTGVRWRQVFSEEQVEELRKLLTSKKGGVSSAKADELIKGLLDKKETLRIVLGTDPARSGADYRALYAADSPLPSGAEVHHFDPLYLGGGHDLLVALKGEAHDAVHAFFSSLQLPPSSRLGAVQLEPNALRAAVKARARPAVVIISADTGQVRYVPL